MNIITRSRMYSTRHHLVPYDINILPRVVLYTYTFPQLVDCQERPMLCKTLYQENLQFPLRCVRSFLHKSSDLRKLLVSVLHFTLNLACHGGLSEALYAHLLFLESLLLDRNQTLHLRHVSNTTSNLSQGFQHTTGMLT